MNISLDKKILLGFVICSVILLIVAISSFRNSEQFLSTNKLVNDTHEILYELEQILVSTINAETGARGFIITGKENFLQPFDSAKLNINQHIQRCRELTRNNEEVQKILVTIDTLMARRLAHLERST